MSKKFLKLLFEKKINKIVIAGTCYEYGLLEGELVNRQKQLQSLNMVFKDS